MDRRCPVRFHFFQDALHGEILIEKIVLTNRTLYLVPVIVVELDPLIKRGNYNLVSVAGIIRQFKRLQKERQVLTPIL